MAPRLYLRGVVANPRDATEHRCGLRLATKANPLAHKYRKASNTALAKMIAARGCFSVFSGLNDA
jgi:hypothetical protein